VQEERIDLILRGVRSVRGRWRLAPDGLEGPPTPVRGRRLEARRGHRAGRRRGPGSPRRHPSLQRPDLSRGQLLPRRHLEFAKAPPRLDAPTLVRCIRDDRRSAVAPFEERLTIRQAEPGLRLGRTVAGLTLLDEQWAD